MADHDVVILGGGPAGLTAAIYACRSRLNTVLVERLMAGGQVASTDWVENYPGFEEGVSGAELMQKMEKQAVRFGLRIVSGLPDSVDLAGLEKTVVVSGEMYHAKTVIIATGTDPKTLGVSGEKEFKGRGVSYCATCDGPFFKDKDVVVVGGGSSGIQESLFLTRFVRSIHVVEFMDHLNAESILRQRAEENPKFRFSLGHRLLSINGDKTVSSVTVEKRSTGERTEIPASGVFVWIGFVPNTAFLAGQVALDPWGYIVTDEAMETSVRGVFACGDVRAKSVRQITTAVSDGTMAAVSALKVAESQERGMA